MRRKINTPCLTARDLVDRDAIGPPFQWSRDKWNVTFRETSRISRPYTRACMGYTDNNELHYVEEDAKKVADRLEFSLGWNIGDGFSARLMQLPVFLEPLYHPTELVQFLRPRDIVHLTGVGRREMYYAVRMRRQAWRITATLTPDGPKNSQFGETTLTGYNLDGTPMEAK